MVRSTSTNLQQGNKKVFEIPWHTEVKVDNLAVANVIEGRVETLVASASQFAVRVRVGVGVRIVY